MATNIPKKSRVKMFQPCLECGAPTTSKFCSKSCSASHNNRGRRHSIATTEKISVSLTGTKHERGNHINVCKLTLKTCSVCGHKWLDSVQKRRKTCSEECATEAKTSKRKYQNGRRALTLYPCIYTGEDVWLESSWEVRVAEALDRKGIQWYRPKPIKWEDAEGKIRLYYPDFYLPNQSVYVDPKNPHCMAQDKEKMEEIKKQVFVVYGEVTAVLRSLGKITGRKLI